LNIADIQQQSSEKSGKISSSHNFHGLIKFHSKPFLHFLTENIISLNGLHYFIKWMLLWLT